MNIIKLIIVILFMLPGFPKMSFSQITELEPNDSFGQAMNFPLYSTVSESIDTTNDIDIFEVSVPKGGTLAIKVDSVPDWGWYSMPIELAVYSSDTTTVIANYFATGGPYYSNSIELNVLVCPGTYYLKVRTILGASSSTAFNTTISLDTTETCECNNYFATACLATIGSTFKEKIDGVNLNDTLYGGVDGIDVDFYEINVTQGGTLKFDIDSIPNWGWYSMPIELTVYASDTTTVIANYFAIGGPYYTNHINIDVPVCSGNYYLKVSTIYNATSSLEFKSTINFEADTISLISNLTSICQGTSIVLTSVGNATNFTINPGNLSSPALVTPSSTTTYTLNGISTNGCNLTSTLTINVNQVVTPTISITVNPDDTVCAGTAVTFASSVTNGGASPGYTWYNNGTIVGTNSSTYSTSSLQNGDVITCQLNSSALCVSSSSVVSNPIAMTVLPIVTPTITITTSPNDTVCVGAAVTFTASATNGGSSPIYTWKNGTTIVGTGINYTTSNLQNGDVVTCQLNSSAPCVSSNNIISNAITMTVLPIVTPTISITVNPDDTVCAGTAVTFTASINNGGSSPSYTWKNGTTTVGTNSSTYTTSSLQNGDVITCQLNSNAPCVSTNNVVSNAITMTVLPIVTPTISITVNPNDTVCTGTSVTFAVNVTNEGTSPIYTWKNGTTTVGTNSSTFTTSSLQNGDVITCQLNSNAPCVSSSTVLSNAITMVVENPLPIPTITLAGNQLTSSNASNCQWYWNNSPVSGGTTNPYTATQSGTYKVCVSNSCGIVCSDTVVFIPVGIHPMGTSNHAITVYPNPTNDWLYVNETSGKTISETIILDLSGKVISKQTKLADRMDVSTLASGLYFIKVQVDGAMYQTKFVKQ